MAPGAMYLPEETSDQFLKKMGQEKSHLYDMDIRGSTPEINLHDLAVQAPSQSLGGSTSFESYGSKSIHGFGLGSKEHEFDSMSSLKGSGASRHKISNLLGSFTMDSKHFDFSEELSTTEKTEFMETIELMEQLSRHGSAMKSIFASVTANKSHMAAHFKQFQTELASMNNFIRELEDKQKKLKRENESLKTSMLKITFKLKEAETSIELYKDKVRERDSSINRLQSELEKTQHELDEMRKEFNMKEAQWVRAQERIEALERERDIAREIASDLRDQLDKSKESESKLQQSNSHLTEENEALRRELAHVKRRLADADRVRDELSHLNRAAEDENRAKQSRINDLESKMEEANDRFEEIMEDSSKVRAQITTVTSRNEVLTKRVEFLHQTKKDTERKLEESQRKVGSLQDAVNHLTSKLGSKHKDYEAVHEEKAKMMVTISQMREQIRKVNNEKDRLLQELRREMAKSEENTRKMSTSEESFKRTELLLKEKTQLNNTLMERIKRMERERNEAMAKCNSIASESKKFETQLSSLQSQIGEVTSRYESTSEQLRESESRYEEVVEAAREVQNSHSELESQISELRRLVNDMREQKEAAISARVTADHERDEAISRYEEKGREMQRALEERHEQASRTLHSNGHSSDFHHSVTQSFKTGGGKKKNKKHTMMGDALTV